MSIIPLEDLLPAGMSFVGFVADGGVDSGTTLAGTSVSMGGNIDATWVAADRTVRIEQRAGTTLPAGATVAANFMVTIDDYSEDVGITNTIGNASATVTPSDGYPIMVLKKDSQRPDAVITDRDARFTVTGPGGAVITDEAYVVDGKARCRRCGRLGCGHRHSGRSRDSARPSGRYLHGHRDHRSRWLRACRFARAGGAGCRGRVACRDVVQRSAAVARHR
ncbi:hypothetical protein GCM10025876_07350 [Demequina litorisediminis]|uniref:Uncharacterized protein n=1 Tax=Demequina litorisediminis TaxID=1849022 RepID=A0ABQ6IBA8_9MICO|nr:hypothetical protein [Demequina litorisediminis]GMA34531.1 hypothetical protein GCM10025876_07350 [Demequina litorisediminis]